MKVKEQCNDNLVWIDPKGGTHYHKFEATRMADMSFSPSNMYR